MNRDPRPHFGLAWQTVLRRWHWLLDQDRAEDLRQEISLMLSYLGPDADMVEVVRATDRQMYDFAKRCGIQRPKASEESVRHFFSEEALIARGGRRGVGRARVMKTCRHCGKDFQAGAIRYHEPRCEKNPKRRQVKPIAELFVAKPKEQTGGVWKIHKPGFQACRCADCNAKRRGLLP